LVTNGIVFTFQSNKAGIQISNQHKTMDKKHDKMMLDLHRIIDAQNFSSEKEKEKFLKSLIGKKIPSLPKLALTPVQQAQDLVYEAYELPPPNAKAYIEKALALDPDCIDAYEFLGNTAPTMKFAMTNFEKGIAIGRRIFGGDYLEENIGSFWRIVETRSFMRCLQAFSDCLIEQGKVKDAVAILEEMIVLNPNDNQGVRDQLKLFLIYLNEDEKYLKYNEMFKDDIFAYALFNEALFAFKTEGETENSNQKLFKALNQNKFVAPKLLSKKPIFLETSTFSMGDENEANYYASFAQKVWTRINGATWWLKKHAF
jgi:tetratricopeptide (TPR) repeat protein